MSKQRCRRFTLFDAMSIVGGVAVVFAGYRARLEPDDFDTDRWVFTVFRGLGSLLLVTSGLILVLRLRRPRPPVWRIVWQPGTAACLVAVLSKLYFMGELIFAQVVHRVPAFDLTTSGWVNLATDTPFYTSASIVPIIWILLGLGRRWRAERGWIDRAGRVVGFGWIAWLVAGSFLN